MHKFAVIPFFALALLGNSFAEDSSQSLDIRTTGYFILDGGWLREAQSLSGRKYEKVAFGDVIGGIVLDAKPSDVLYLRINPELKSSHPFPEDLSRQYELRFTASDVYMEEAKLAWVPKGGSGPVKFDGEVGLIVYKENPDTKIFGDYLFRSWIYPGIIFTKFNYPKTPILGMRLGNRLGEGFSQNLFITSESKYYPLYDISIAYTADYSFKNLVDVGVGANFKSIIPVHPSRTTPNKGVDNIDNIYKEVGFQTVTVPGDTAKHRDPKTVIIAPNGPDSTFLIVVDTIGNADTARIAGQGLKGLSKSDAYSVEGMSNIVDDDMHLLPGIKGKEIKYSFSGILAMARFAVNPLGFMPENPLGKNALKVYVETAVLGWKNYPLFYEKRSERMPIMFGINLPTMNYLDFLTVEVEHYKSPIYSGTNYRNEYLVPIPAADKLNADWNDATKIKSLSKRDDWKWGVVTKKSFKGIALVAQVGTDHTRMADPSGHEDQDILQNPDEWYFQFRFIGGIY